MRVWYIGICILCFSALLIITLRLFATRGFALLIGVKRWRQRFLIDGIYSYIGTNKTAFSDRLSFYARIMTTISTKKEYLWQKN